MNFDKHYLQNICSQHFIQINFIISKVFIFFLLNKPFFNFNLFIKCFQKKNHNARKMNFWKEHYKQERKD